MSKYDLESIMLQFQTSAQFVKSEAYGGGHINDTFKIEMKKDDLDKCTSNKDILEKIRP